jgi:hypothetical protein
LDNGIRSSDNPRECSGTQTPCDLGRPDQMQLIFNRGVTRQTPDPCRTRILTDGVVPPLLVDYKKSRVKQYHKEGQALRTETTINNTYDVEIGRALRNRPALREIGFAANRRLWRVEYLSHDCRRQPPRRPEPTPWSSTRNAPRRSGSATGACST